MNVEKGPYTHVNITEVQAVNMMQEACDRIESDPVAKVLEGEDEVLFINPRSIA